MATQAEKLLRIEKDGRQVAVTEAAYKSAKVLPDGQTYEGAGWKVVSYEDGTAYDGDAEPTKYAMNKAARTNDIGVGGSDPRTIDGDKAGDDLIAASGVTLASEAAPKRARSGGGASEAISTTPQSAL